MNPKGPEWENVEGMYLAPNKVQQQSPINMTMNLLVPHQAANYILICCLIQNVADVPRDRDRLL